jgi:iron complex outermembrane receptor protein
MITNTIQRISTLLNLDSVKGKLQVSDVGLTSLLIRCGLVAFLIFGLGVLQESNAQVDVSGTVTDAEDGLALPGVNVIVKGMPSRGTSTDGNGQYSLTVPSAQDTLLFSFIGYITREVPVNGRNTVDVTLSSDIQQLEDVVVVGYGTQERQQITGSISSVREEDFVKGSINNASELIQGKVPGLTISSAGGGDPNSNPTIRLRGISSFGSTQDPLVVIDGVIGGNLNNVDPNDIASIEVLKDASASAIYGTRASAGVIVVTTKSGQVGQEQISISYNGYASFETIERKNDVLNVQQYNELANLMGINAPTFGSNTDWFEEITQDAMSHIHSLALSGSSENTSYRISGNFRDREGIQKQTGFEQVNGRVNVSQRALDQKLNIDLNIGFTSRKEDHGFPQAFRYAQTFNPTAPVKVDSFATVGNYFEQPLFDYFNPRAIIDTRVQEQEREIVTGSLRGEYEFRDMIPGLRASAFYSIENNKDLFRQFSSKTSKHGGNATTTAFGTGFAQRNVSDEQEELFEATFNYIHDLRDLSLEALAGYSYTEIVREGTNVGGGDFVSDAVGFNNLSYAQDFSQGEGSVSSFHNSHKVIGFFGRLNLNWDNTYFANGSYRHEGSSWFGEDNKWGNFWSVGGGIELTSFIDIPVVNQLKIRGSYGVTGQDAPFSGISRQIFRPAGNFFANGSFIQSFAPASNPNPNLKWEERKELNVGADFELLESRLTGSVEYYRKKVDDLLFPISVPVPPNLFPTTWDNIGSLESSGVEVGLNYDVIQTSDLNWRTGVTGAWFSPTILEEFVSEETQFISNAGSPGLNDTPLIKVEEGEPIGEIFGKRFAEIGPNGEWLFFDQNGNKVTADQITLDDQEVLGNGLPDFQLGWTNDLNYKNWNLSLFFRGVFGHQLVNTFRLFYETPNQISSYNVLDSAFDLVNRGENERTLRESPQFSDFQVENGDFVKLQNATIGYTFSGANFNYVRQLRVYASVNNVFTITNYKGINPEPRYVDSGDNDNPLAPGIERRDQWFTSRTFSLGVNIEF